MDENIIIKWLTKIIIPYIGTKDCMLIWDTYEAHKSNKVLEFLKQYPNIYTSSIVGGRTSVDQPLDISVNKQFKTVCKSECIKSTNKILEYLENSNNLCSKNNQRQEGIVKSKKDFCFY